MRLLAITLGLVACHGNPAPPAPAVEAAEPRWLKGQTHVHSANSGDSETPPAEVAAWYARHGFDFIVFTDHNHVTTLPDAPLLAIPGVELTQNLKTCVPPPEPGDACLLHVNALFVEHPRDIELRPRPDQSRREIFDAALALTTQLGAIAQLNHPNFHWAIDARLLAQLAGDGAQLVEIRNEAYDNRNAGDAHHPDTEALWDAALTAGAHVWGVASDDAHHYDDAEAERAAGHDVFVGNIGWIRVRAALEPAAIRDAIVRGEFYSTNGVELGMVDRNRDAIEISVASRSPGDHVFRLISDGAVVEQKTGRRARFELAKLPGRYARVDITSSDGHRAWTQPVYLR